jgi:hypothetical protein
MQNGKKVAIVAASACALAGAAAGISQSAADSTSSSSSSTQTAHAPRGGMVFGFARAGHPGPGGEVHAVEVVLNKAGTDYITVTEDNGTITAIDASAGKITLEEGTEKVTYATPTIAIPSGATVLLDGASSSLDKLKAGDRVSISSSSEGTTVFATDSSFKPPAPDGMRHVGPPPGGAPPPEGAPQPPGEAG